MPRSRPFHHPDHPVYGSESRNPDRGRKRCSSRQQSKVEPGQCEHQYCHSGFELCLVSSHLYYFLRPRSKTDIHLSFLFLSPSCNDLLLDNLIIDGGRVALGSLAKGAGLLELGSRSVYLFASSSFVVNRVVRRDENSADRGSFPPSLRGSTGGISQRHTVTNCQLQNCRGWTSLHFTEGSGNSCVGGSCRSGSVSC